MKRNKIIKLIAFFFTILLVFNLAACTKPKKSAPKKEKLPSAQTVLISAQNTKFNNLHSTWLQTDNNNHTLQKAEVKYNRKPLVVYANFTTNANHYKMWMKGKQNYIQMAGTDTNRWFKTKLSKKASYVQLTGDLATAAIISFSKEAKLFKVSKTNSGYALTYSGKNKKIWHDINQGSMISSVIGIDLDDAKPGKTTVTFRTDRKYHLQNAQIDAAYTDEGKERNMKMNIDQINKVGKLSVPSHIVKSAVDLGR